MNNILNYRDSSFDALEQKAQLVDRILSQTYGAPFPFFSNKDPLSQLISALLSHRTKNRVSGLAYRNLVQAFPSWEAVRDAPVEAIIAAISPVTYPEVKGPRIQKILQLITERNQGNLSLDWLEDLPVQDARQWLEALPGVGVKTSAAVLNFSRLHLPALVVDMHHLRVAQRIGLVPSTCTLDKGARILESYLPEESTGQQVYDNHQGFMRHGQKVCFWKNPDCKACPVRELCNYYLGKEQEALNKEVKSP